MSKVSIVYWTQGGNTQAMAEAIGEGVTAAGGEADVVFVSDANIADLKAEGAFALGCPAMAPRCLRKWRWNLLFRMLRGLPMAKRSRYLVLMDGEMVSGCATGKTA